MTALTSHYPLVSPPTRLLSLPFLTSLFHFTFLKFVLLPYHFDYHRLSQVPPSLLHYPPTPPCISLLFRSSSLPGCRVMYGPCQRWNQWDASCFNLAWEPSGSRSSASWKTDDIGLSFLRLRPPNPPLPFLVGCVDQHLASIGGSSAKENRKLASCPLPAFWIHVNRRGTLRAAMPAASVSIQV